MLFLSNNILLFYMTARRQIGEIAIAALVAQYRYFLETLKQCKLMLFPKSQYIQLRSVQDFDPKTPLFEPALLTSKKGQK
jgi:hypothetical protein